MDPLTAKIIYMLGYWIANFVIRAPHIKVRHQGKLRTNRNSRVDTALFLGVGVGGFLVPLLYVFTPLLAFADYSIPLWIGLAGVAVLVLGDWVFWKSHKDLGKQWSPVLEIRQDHALVTQGIYRHIRHPMYLSIWLLVISQAMILPNYIAGFAGLLPFATLYFQRIGREERMMHDEFGSDYEQHLQRTGRLFPKIWRRGSTNH